jgi:hypothetical protein
VYIEIEKKREIWTKYCSLMKYLLLGEPGILLSDNLHKHMNTALTKAIDLCS